jgi:hypothetical protein
LAAISGASTRELRGRMGHVSVNAALVYQHRTASRDRAIADSLDAMVAALNAEARDRSGRVGGTATGQRAGFDFCPSRRMLLRLGLSSLERMTGIEPALSAWEDNRGSTQRSN